MWAAMAGNEGRQFFGRNASVLLDVLRFGAAIAVALSHMPLHYVAAGPIISERSGNLAVCVFFVLSGFVIRYVTVARVPDGRAYWIDRASRIYSVVVPMLLLTYILQPLAGWWSPTVYHAMAQPYTWSEMPREVLQNLTFTVGWWGYGPAPLSNAPFWSLSFECVYYALYGFWRYAPRARRWAVPLLLLAAGPSIALLFPIWLLGVALHDCYVWLHEKRRGLLIAVGALVVYLTPVLLLRRPIARILRTYTVTVRTDLLTRYVASQGWGRLLFHGQTLPWLDRLSISYFLLGTFMAFAMLPVLLALDRFVPASSKRFAAGVRLVADSTFPLYLLHWPYFLFVVCLHGGAIATWKGGWVMLLSAIVISIGLALVFDRLKNAMRAGLREHAPARRPQVQPSV